jgi:hypothetical protein
MIVYTKPVNQCSVDPSQTLTVSITSYWLTLNPETSRIWITVEGNDDSVAISDVSISYFRRHTK